jgi:hypothetical protein
VRDSERPRGDPDYGIRLPIEADRLVEDRRIAAESFTPELFADHDHLRGVGPVVGRGQHTPAKRSDTEQRKEIPGHALHAHLRRFVGQLKQRGGRRDGSEPVELPSRAREIRIVRW